MQKKLVSLVFFLCCALSCFPQVTTYTYSTTTDIIAGDVCLQALAEEIEDSSIVTSLFYVTEFPTIYELQVAFASPLTTSEKTTFDGDTTNPAGGIIGNHDPSPCNLPGDIIDDVKLNSEDVAPTTTADASNGYPVGRIWIDEAELEAYVLTDNTTGNAVWENFTTTDAIDINYDNSISGLTATDVQDALDEIEGRVDDAEADGATSAATITDHAIVRGDGGAKGVQDSNVTIDDTGHVQFISGSGGSPSVRIGSSDTGFWEEGSGDLALCVSGSELFEVTVGGAIIAAAGNPNYETKVTSNQVLTNKKYVDDAITNAEADMASVQARRTTSYTLTASFVDITFDTTDVENVASVVEHDNTNTERLVAKTTGLHMLVYNLAWMADQESTLYMQLKKNGTTVVPGSEVHAWEGEPDDDTPDLPISRTTLVSLTANDYVTLQLKHGSGTNKVKIGTTFQMIRLRGH